MKGQPNLVMSALVAFGLTGAIVGAVLVGCSADGGPAMTTEEAGAAEQETRAEGATPSVASAKSPAQLWADNCMRCHNFRDPTSLSDADWDVAVHHMRVRGNLLAEEHEKILEFLQASN